MGYAGAKGGIGARMKTVAAADLESLQPGETAQAGNVTIRRNRKGRYVVKSSKVSDWAIPMNVQQAVKRANALLALAG